MRNKIALSTLIFLWIFSYADEARPQQPVYLNKTSLGQALFFDVGLSKNRTQSCASCHVPEHGFIDSRDNKTNGAVSIGDDGVSLGVRNTPTLSYAAFAPAFHQNLKGDYLGGFFYDGRAADLNEQAAVPLLSPTEMALVDADMLALRIKDNPAYVAAMENLFHEAIFSDNRQVYKAVTSSIAAFEKTPQFAPFDSKYDRYLRGDYTMTPLQEKGRLVFFSSLISCNGCHQLAQTDKETFTDYSYHNIGVPTNPSLRQIHDNLADQGLFENPAVDDPRQRGKFKVPTLRNIAVTAPYMHNGVFSDLRTVMKFYNKYIIEGTLNPETGEPWRDAEVGENISTDLLKQGQPTSDYLIEALIAFMQTLTDQRYEKYLNR
jgi:cytochrome c peroxidase